MKPKTIIRTVTALAVASSAWLAGGQTVNTNLPASIVITVSTNVTSGDNSSGCNMCYDQFGNWKGTIPAVMNSKPCLPFHPATERWVITNVVKKTEVTVQYDGRAIFSYWETVLSGTTNRWKLTQDWKKD